MIVTRVITMAIAIEILEANMTDPSMVIVLSVTPIFNVGYERAASLPPLTLLLLSLYFCLRLPLMGIPESGLSASKPTKHH